MNSNVTTRQQEVLNEIESFTAKKGFPPTFRELSVPFGLSINGIVSHLHALRRKGLVTFEWKKSRTLRVVPQPTERGMPVVTLEQLSNAGIKSPATKETYR